MNSDTKSLSPASGNAVGPTPGPWKAGWRGAAGWSISNGTWAVRLLDHRVTKADAHLIAAAPDLLAALKEITDPARGMVSIPQSKAAFERAYAAIAKAEGR